MELNQLKKILEGALLASANPRPLPQLGALFTEEDAVGHDQMAAALAALAADCEGRGIELVEVASGFRYQVRQDVYPWVARMWTERPSRYSRALLETLALIAYRQPITRGEIEQIRGVAVSSNIIRTLEEREWVRVVGHRDVVGKPALFGSTRGFLDYFNLKSLDELPPLAEILDMEDLNPQFAFDDGEGVPARAAMPSDGEGEGEPTDDQATPVAANDADDDDATGTLDADTGHDAAPASGAEPQATATTTDITGEDLTGEDVDDQAVTGTDIPTGEALPEPDTTAAEAETPADADQAPAGKDPKENRA